MPLSFFGPYPDGRREPGRGQIVHWTFADELADAHAGMVPATSGRARHRLSLLSGATVEPLDGAPGGHGLRLTGDGAGATVGDPPDLNFGTAGFSVALWLRTSMHGIGRVVSKGSYGWTPGYFLSVGHGGEGHLGFGVGGGATWGGGGSVECFTAEPLVGDDRWHHVCAAFDGVAGEIRLYVDGAGRAIDRRAGTDGTALGDVLRLRDTSPAVAASPLALTIGSHLGRHELFAGELTDLRFFGSGITADEVEKLAGR